MPPVYSAWMVSAYSLRGGSAHWLRTKRGLPSRGQRAGTAREASLGENARRAAGGRSTALGRMRDQWPVLGARDRHIEEPALLGQPDKDGVRAQLRYDGRSSTLRTRSGRECSEHFPELAEIAQVFGKRRATLDGELVCLRPDGRPDFARLRRRLIGSGSPPAPPAMLQVFDVLHLNGRSTRSLAYTERRALLDELALDGPAWRTPASVVVDRAEDFVARVADLGLEGVVAKRRDSRYLPGRRSTGWLKHKLRREERLAVTGLRRSAAGAVQAIFVARHRTDGLIHRCRRHRARPSA
jgi:hypothetical protein